MFIARHSVRKKAAVGKVGGLRLSSWETVSPMGCDSSADITHEGLARCAVIQYQNESKGNLEQEALRIEC